jgi:hypothetical protein
VWQYLSKITVKISSTTITRRYILFLYMPPKERGIVMLAILHHVLKFIMVSVGSIGCMFMLGCTILVVHSIIHGDIKVNLIKENIETGSKKEN